MGCTTTSLKFFVIILNILCAIFGALMVTASAYCLNDFSNSEIIQLPCAVGMALGLLLFLTIIPGCCGPLRASVRALWIYAFCIWLLMCGQIVVNLVLPLNFDKLAAETIDIAWRADFSLNGTMAAYETKFSCCGRVGPQDYALSGLTIPPSCYNNQNSSVDGNLFTVGCVTRLTDQFEDAKSIETISDWTLVGVEFLSGFFAGMLAINLKNVQRRKQFH